MQKFDRKTVTLSDLSRARVWYIWNFIGKIMLFPKELQVISGNTYMSIIKINYQL